MNIRILLLFLICISCAKTAPRMPINPKPSTTLLSETLDASKTLNKLEETKILNYIKRDSLNNYIQSSNGFWYKYIHKINKDLPTPTKGNEVVFEYEILDLNDSIIYAKKDLGLKTYKIDKEDFITGLQKGLKIMKEGETISFIIPSYSAFGVTGDGDKIGINQTIKSTVTLINIK